MNKKTLIVTIAIIIIIILIAFTFFVIRPKTKLLNEVEEKETIFLEEELKPIPLTEEEEKILTEEGVSLPSYEDPKTIDLKNVRVSDEIEAIEKDLNETDLSDIDKEAKEIENDLSGL